MYLSATNVVVNLNTAAQCDWVSAPSVNPYQPGTGRTFAPTLLLGVQARTEVGIDGFQFHWQEVHVNRLVFCTT